MGSMEANAKKYITSLLTSTPLVVTLQQLNKDYRNMIGEPIPYQKLGYNSLEHFLRSIPDTVQVRGSGPMAQIIPAISEKSAHINNLVTSQKIVKRKTPGRPPQKRYSYYPQTHWKPVSQAMSTPMQPTRKIVYPSTPLQNCHVDSESSNDVSEPVTCKISETKEETKNKVASVTNLKETSDNVSENVVSSSSLDSNCKLVKLEMPHVETSRSSQRVVTNVTNLKGTSDNVSETVISSSLLDSSCRLVKVEKPRVETTTTPSRTRQQLLKEDVSLEDVGSKRCSNVSQRFPGGMSKLSTELRSGIPYCIKSNLRTLMSQFPNGIWCADVPSQYRKMFKQELKYQELGFRSLIDLCVCLPSVFHYVRPTTEDFKLYDRSRPLPDCAEKVFTVATYSVNTPNYSNVDGSNALPNIDWIDVRTFFPEGIFKPGEEIPRVFISHDTEVNDKIEVAIGEIYDPSKFWVYRQNSGLDKLMDEMQDFYKSHAREYHIPENFIREGLYCVQVIYGEYHRALIVDVMPEIEDTIRVVFIDYGTMSKVPMKGVCFLHRDFAKLPAQAIRCRLANIFPVEEGLPWCREASMAFRRVVTNRTLLAKINSINWEEQFLEVHLADITDGDVFYINEKLIEEGFGQYADKERQQLLVEPTYTPIVKYIHLFPTFLELEHGLAPSTAEMEVFYDCEVPLNFCYPHYFHVDYSVEEEIIKEAEHFHEEHCIKGKRKAPARYYDLEQFKSYKPDLAYFGDLQDEISKVMNKPLKKENNSDEDFEDADEDVVINDVRKCVEVEAVTKELKTLNTNEEETISTLKKDISKADSFTKDIASLTTAITCNDLSNENLQSNENVWCTNESIQTSEGMNSAATVLFNHPLSQMTFDKNSSEDEYSTSVSPDSDENKLYDRDMLLLSSDSSTDVVPSDEPVSQGSIFDFTFNVSDKACDGFTNNIEDEVTVGVKINVFTNPFVDNLSIASTDLNQLSPNNPFLKYLTKEDTTTPEGVQDDESSSTSTEYQFPITKTSPEASWLKFDDISTETIRELGRSLRSNSSSASACESNDKTNNSTQTSEGSLRPPPVQNNFCAYPYPVPQPMVHYGYPTAPSTYNNPYYAVRYSNYLYEAQYGTMHMWRPTSPGLCPPPGFAPLPYRREGSVPSLNCGNFPPQLKRPQNYNSCGDMLHPRPDVTPQNSRPYYASPSQGVSGMREANSLSSLSVGGASKDFYDIYNEQLKTIMERTDK